MNLAECDRIARIMHKFKKYESAFGKELEGVLLGVKSKKFLHEVLIDLLSPSEYKDLALRWQVMKMLYRGYSQREIRNKLRVSIGMVTRGSRELQNKKGGFAALLKKHIKIKKKN